MKIFTVIKNIFKSIKIAIKNPYKYDVIDNAINGYSFDYANLYELEKAKLIEMRNYFNESGIAANSEDMVKKIDLAVKLLDIANESTDTFGYRFLEEENYHKPGTPAWTNLDDEYFCKVKVNTKNYKRFFNDNEFLAQYLMKHPHEVYIKKAQYLYHKLRDYFEQTWWD